MYDDIDWDDPVLLQYTTPTITPQDPSSHPNQNSSRHGLTNQSINSSTPSIRPSIHQFNVSHSNPYSVNNNVRNTAQPYIISHTTVQPCHQHSSHGVNHSNDSSDTSTYDVPDSFFDQIELPTPTPVPTNTTNTILSNSLNVLAYSPSISSKQSNATPATNNPYINLSTTSTVQSATQPQVFTSAPLTLQQHNANASAPRIPMCRKHNVAMIQNSTRKPGPNLGRKFWACALPKDDACHEFVWDNDKYVDSALVSVQFVQ